MPLAVTSFGFLESDRPSHTRREACSVLGWGREPLTFLGSGWGAVLPSLTTQLSCCGASDLGPDFQPLLCHWPCLAHLCAAEPDVMLFPVLPACPCCTLSWTFLLISPSGSAPVHLHLGRPLSSSISAHFLCAPEGKAQAVSGFPCDPSTGDGHAQHSVLPERPGMGTPLLSGHLWGWPPGPVVRRVPVGMSEETLPLRW